MKQRTLATIGIAGTVLLMAGLLAAVYYYIQNPDMTGAMIAMGTMSTGLMTFLVIFAVFYMRPPSDKDRYMEIYQNTCSQCGSTFGEDGICPKCGKRRFQKED